MSLWVILWFSGSLRFIALGQSQPGIDFGSLEFIREKSFRTSGILEEWGVGCWTPGLS